MIHEGAKNIINHIKGFYKSKYTNGKRSLSTLVTKTHDLLNISWQMISFGINVLNTT